MSDNIIANDPEKIKPLRTVFPIRTLSLLAYPIATNFKTTEGIPNKARIKNIFIILLDKLIRPKPSGPRVLPK